MLQFASRSSPCCLRRGSQALPCYCRAAQARARHSTVTLLAKFRGLSTSVPLAQAV